MALPLPRAVHLPSGQRVELHAASAERAAPALSADAGGPFAEALAILSAEGVLRCDGAPLDVYTLPLRDVHTLRALLSRSGLVAESSEQFVCENCGAPFDVAPSSLLEIGPFIDGELSDPELDEPFPFGEPLPIPRLILPAPRPPPRRSGLAPRRGTLRGPRDRYAETVTFAERTAGDARALFRAADALFTGRVRSLKITPALVMGMGIVALGSERRAQVLAEALATAPHAAWARLIDHFHDAAYSRRLFSIFRCAECGARNDLDVPLARELDREPPLREGELAKDRGARPPFPDLDAFEELVHKHAERIYAKRGLRNIDLFVDAGVPHCDDGGEPLLGSYLPGGVDEETFVPRAPEVRIYYRTFETQYAFDPGFDVEGEIRETIDHELLHHLHHLSGEDPMDADERAEIAREHVRRVGARESARRERQALWSDATGFFRATWPLWVAVLLVAALLWSSR